MKQPVFYLIEQFTFSHSYSSIQAQRHTVSNEQKNIIICTMGMEPLRIFWWTVAQEKKVKNIYSRFKDFSVPLNHLLFSVYKFYSAKREGEKHKQNKYGRGEPTYKGWLATSWKKLRKKRHKTGMQGNV